MSAGRQAEMYAGSRQTVRDKWSCNVFRQTDRRADRQAGGEAGSRAGRQAYTDKRTGMHVFLRRFLPNPSLSQKYHLTPRKAE